MAPINGYLFEKNYTTYDIAAELQQALNFKADIVVAAYGENADSLAMVAHSVPEPGSLILSLAGTLCVAAYIWRVRR